MTGFRNEKVPIDETTGWDLVFVGELKIEDFGDLEGENLNDENQVEAQRSYFAVCRRD
ncbi:MAG: hypothetical protein WBD36_10205 [Bacteroidota bacterium]